MVQKGSSVGGWVGGGGTGIAEETRRGKGAGRVREERSGDCPSQPVRPGIEGQRMPAIGGNSHVSHSWTATWLRSPRSVPVLDVSWRAIQSLSGYMRSSYMTPCHISWRIAIDNLLGLDRAIDRLSLQHPD